MGDAHSAHHNNSPGVALPTSSCSVNPLRASSGFLCIDSFEICIHHLNPQLELEYHGKYRAPLHDVVQLFIRYIHLLRLICLINSRVPLHITARCVASCLLSSTALKSLIIASGCFPSWRFWGPINSGFAYDWELRGGSQISTGREDFAGGSAVLPMLSEGLEIELSDFEAENVTLRGDYLWQVVEIVIGGVPTVLEVRFMCLFKSLRRILLEGSVSTNLFSPMRYQVDLQKVEVSI